MRPFIDVVHRDGAPPRGSPAAELIDRRSFWLVTSAISLGVAVALRVWPLHGVASDYDEGVYWRSLRVMSLGHPLYTTVFSSQPPGFLSSILPMYRLLGQSLVAARLAVVAYSLLGLVAMYRLARTAAGRSGRVQWLLTG